MAASARRRTEAKLDATIQQQPEVERVAAAAEHLRRRNGFGEAIEVALQRRSP